MSGFLPGPSPFDLPYLATSDSFAILGACLRMEDPPLPRVGPLVGEGHIDLTDRVQPLVSKP